MANIPSGIELDSDNDSADTKCHTRPLAKGESVPRIPSMLEQMDMAWAASNKPAHKSR
jgi:hypothetical protein